MSDSAQSRAIQPTNAADQVHFRVLAARCLVLPKGTWNTQNVLSPFWRFYRNETDGAFLRLPNREGSGTFPIEAGRVYFVPEGVRFGCGNDADFSHFYLHFDVVGLLPFTLQALFSQPVALAPCLEFEQRVHEFAQQMKDSDGPLPLPTLLRAKSLLYEGMARYLESVPSHVREQGLLLSERLAPIAPALRLMESHFSEPLPTTKLAGACCLSADYFARTFKARTGHTPVAYLTHRRVTLAAQRLLFTKDSLDTIAGECGFGNRFYFSRIFGKVMGSSPAAYRKAGHKA